MGQNYNCNCPCHIDADPYWSCKLCYSANHMAALPRRTARPKAKPAHQKREPRKFVASPEKKEEKTA